MPYTVSTREDLELGIICLSGDIRAATLARALADLIASSGWHPGFNTLWQGAAIRQVLLTPEDVNDLVALSDRLQHRMGPGREAVVVTPGMHTTFARMFEHESKHTVRSRHVFHSTAAALRWLVDECSTRIDQIDSTGVPYAA